MRLSGPGGSAVRRGRPAAVAAVAALLLACAAGAPSRAQAPEPAPAPAAPVSDREMEESARQLAALRERIQAHRERAAALADRERDAAARLRSIEEEIGLVRTLLGNLDVRERILQQRSDTLRAELSRHQTEFGRRRDDLARRLRALYVRGPRSDLEAVLTANSYTALVARLKYATLMARLDRRLLDRTREQSSAVLTQEGELKAALTGIWEAREEARRERSRLEEIEAERQAGLRGVRQERRQVESSLGELEANARRLTDVLAALENRRLGGTEPVPPAGAPALGEPAGRLPWPVEGPVLRPFGRSVHPEFKTVTVHNGIAIGAPLGAPVRTVAAGTIVFVDRLPGYGQCVIVDHGDGFYSLYAHAARVFVARGDRVTEGQVVAEVGEPEGGGKPQLYFEIRRGRTPVDPLPWLRARG
ncbi:MAG: murein hydrolase activator EnvC family protein [Candidatus Krumholzibacteriia bacterium]